MFSSKPSRSSRHSSSSHRRQDSDRRPDSEREPESSRRRIVSSKDLQITFENIICHMSKETNEALDKESVIRMTKCIYNWIVFDRDMQLDLPIAAGSKGSVKMWPHGAVVDTRRKSTNEYGEGSSRKLQDLGDDHAINIASSVVSSTPDEERSTRSRGEVMYETPRGQVYSPGNYIAPGAMYPPQHGNVGSGIPGGPPMGFMPPPRATRIVPDGFNPALQPPRAVPRYSVLGGAQAPVIAEETPEMRSAEVYPKKKGKKPKVGATRRQTDDDGAIPVTFAD